MVPFQGSGLASRVHPPSDDESELTPDSDTTEPLLSGQYQGSLKSSKKSRSPKDSLKCPSLHVSLPTDNSLSDKKSQSRDPFPSLCDATSQCENDYQTHTSDSWSNAPAHSSETSPLMNLSHSFTVSTIDPWSRKYTRNSLYENQTSPKLILSKKNSSNIWYLCEQKLLSFFHINLEIFSIVYKPSIRSWVLKNQVRQWCRLNWNLKVSIYIAYSSCFIFHVSEIDPSCTQKTMSHKLWVYFYEI